jgi:pimeloyl-ACP methyl ester carboxylesterase
LSRWSWFPGCSARRISETAILERADYRPFLPEIRCPTLVVVGAEDAITPPPMAEEMAQGIAGARLEIVADCGHLSILERPAETSALLEAWLRA